MGIERSGRSLRRPYGDRRHRSGASRCCVGRASRKAHQRRRNPSSAMRSCRLRRTIRHRDLGRRHDLLRARRCRHCDSGDCDRAASAQSDRSARRAWRSLAAWRCQCLGGESTGYHGRSSDEARDASPRRRRRSFSLSCAWRAADCGRFAQFGQSALMFAYIPARGGSKRIPRKNVRPLHGKPVLARVIENLKPLEFLSAIYVSTDDPEIAELAQKIGAKYLKARAPELSNDKAGFMDLIRDDLPNFMTAEGGDDEVLFVLPTAALVPTDIFRNAHVVWTEKKPEILMSCETCF